MAVADRMETQARQGCAEIRKIGAQNGEFEVVVRPHLLPVPEIERPAADDAPGPCDAG